MNLNNKALIFLALGVAVVALLSIEANGGKITERSAKVIKVDEDVELIGGKKIDKRAIDDDDEDRPVSKKVKKRKKSGPMGGDKSTTTGSPQPMTSSNKPDLSTTTAKPSDGSTTAKADAGNSTTKRSAASTADNDDPDSSTMQNLMKNQRQEKKLLDKAYQSLKDYVGFIETHDKMVLNPVSASQMVSYVNALVPKYLTRTYANKAKKAIDSDDNDFALPRIGAPPRHESKRYQFTRLGY